MKFLADPQKRRPWVLIPLKELFYVKSRAREDILAFIYQPRFRLTNGRTHSHICGIIYPQIRFPSYLILPQWQKTKLMKKKSSIKASFKESYRPKNFVD